MTILDLEVVEVLREEPELLALADALQSTDIAVPAHSTRRRVPAFRLGAVALAAVAAVVLLLVSPWSGGPSLADRALAAIGTEPVLHVVVRYRLGDRIDLRTGRIAPVQRTGEVWYDSTRHVYRAVTRIDGQVVYRSSGTGNLSDEPYLLSTLYRQALEQGKLHETGKAVVRGRPAIVVGGAGHGQSMRAYLDADSYRVLRMQFYVGSRLAWQLDVLRYETVSREQANLPQPQPRPGPVPSVAGVGVSGAANLKTIGLDQARSALPGRPLWAGRVVDGHRLTTIQKEDVTDTSRGVTVRGTRLSFSYGQGGRLGSEPYLQVEEGPASSPTWRVESVYPPPPGFVDLASSQSGTGPGHMRTQWLGVLQENGFVVQLTSWSRSTLLATARALRPLP
jgi:hypothetical protein